MRVCVPELSPGPPTPRLTDATCHRTCAFPLGSRCAVQTLLFLCSPCQCRVLAGKRGHSGQDFLKGAPVKVKGKDWSTEKVPRSGTAPKPGGKRVTTGTWKPQGGGKGYPQLCPSEDTQGGDQGMAHLDPALSFSTLLPALPLGQSPPEASWQRSSTETVIQVASGPGRGAAESCPGAVHSGLAPSPVGLQDGGAHAAAAALRGCLWATEQTVTQQVHAAKGELSERKLGVCLS